MTVLNWLLTNLNQQNKIESAVNLECEMQFYVLCLIGYSRLLIIRGNSDQDHLRYRKTQIIWRLKIK